MDGATRGAFVGVLEALDPQLLLAYEIDRLDMDKYTMRPLLHARHLLQFNTEVRGGYDKHGIYRASIYQVFDLPCFKMFPHIVSFMCNLMRIKIRLNTVQFDIPCSLL